MALELILNSLDGVPEVLHGEYTKQSDGTYRLGVNGMEDVSGLKKNNAELLEEKRKAQEKLKLYEGIEDPAKAKEALARLRQLEEKDLLEKGEVEKVIEKRTQMMRTDHENQVKQLNTALDGTKGENERLRSQLSKAVIERGILDAVTAVGQPRKEAMIDIISRGLGTFKLDDNGNPIPQNADGSTIFGKDGQKAMTMSEWAASLLESAPHLFLESKGGGAKGSMAAVNGTQLSAEQMAALSPAQKMELGRRGTRQ